MLIIQLYWRNYLSESKEVWIIPGGRGGTLLYGLYRYVWPQRVGFFSHFRLRVVPLSLGPSFVARGGTVREGWLLGVLGVGGAWREGVPPSKPKSLPSHGEWFFSVGFLILTSSYYRLLSITLGDVLNKMTLLFKYQVARQNHAVRSISLSWCSLGETAKEVSKRRQQIFSKGGIL